MTDVSCGITTVTEGAAYFGNDPNNTHTCTQEQIFSPIVVRKQGTVDMGFQVPSISPAADMGPFQGFHVGPTRGELDPYFSRFAGDSGSTWITNVDFQCVANNANEGDTNLRKVSRSSVSRVHTSGLRGPLMVSGWGTDLADKPVPSQGASGGSAFTFDGDAIGDRKLWKTGPVDLKWDHERKVWSGGPQILCGVAKSKITAGNPCTPTKFTVSVFRSDSITVGQEQDGITDETITCYHYDPSLSQEHVPGYVFVVAVRINYKWVPIWVGCPEKSDHEDPETKEVTPPECVSNVSTEA